MTATQQNRVFDPAGIIRLRAGHTIVAAVWSAWADYFCLDGLREIRVVLNPCTGEYDEAAPRGEAAWP